MPNWKKVIVSGSDATLNSLYVTNNITTSNIYVSGGVTSVDYIQFDTSSTNTRVEGKMYWNSTDRTIDLGIGNSSTLQLGQELYNPIIVNKSGEDLLEGTVVMLHPTSPAQGNRIAVVKCISNGTYLADKIVGVLTEDVANNQEGFATWFGYVRNVPKTIVQPAGETWVEGDLLYTHPTIPGALTHTLPTAPNLKVTMGWVSSINGNNVTIMVKPFLRSFLGKLHDVLDTSTTSSYGDLLIKSGSVWTNSRQLTGSYGLTGSLTSIDGGFTGSLLGTSSYALTASYIAGGSGTSFPYSGSAIITGSLTISAPNGYAEEYANNYFELGTALTLQGSQEITGSLTLSPNYAVTADYVNIGKALQLSNVDPLPAVGVGLLAVSASNLYYSNGLTWSQIN